VAALTGYRTAGAPARPRFRLRDDLAGLGFIRRTALRQVAAELSRPKKLVSDGQQLAPVGVEKC
jgi:hypothetical protein